ncbi:integrase [Psychromonas sp. B3M02]|uniref:phage integrase N-terminal domain-containing protein n=1 Tax=Psychromonas sp. B3M02 TaxID=2267226 RepID=UPI000DE98DAC|nr:phage integrase N-terminal domain-containing protein [Psychromonas sp. B3M02]RBW47292.1 integrase [Psychromonas sp. B3M02]
MNNLNYELKNLCTRNKDGSFSTQNSRGKRLQNIANLLHANGYRKMSASSLKPKHINSLVQHWTKEERSPGTIKNYMTALRWWAEKIGKPSIISRSNDYYGIQERKFVTNEDKSRSIENAALEKVKDEHVKHSLQLQKAFGLRREESIKFIPEFADRGDHILLKNTWTKGGKERIIEIRNDEQRKILDAAHKFVGKSSLIPQHRNYIQQLKIYEGHTAQAELSKLHGLRHKFAQDLYLEITGWKAPVCGGLTSKNLTKEQKAIDKEARLFISKQLGHEREQITAIYLGR